MEPGKLLKLLQNDPLVKKIIEEKDSDLVSLRKRAIAEITVFNGFKMTATKKYERALAEAERDIVQNRARLDISLKKKGKLNHEFHVEMVDHETTLNRLRGFLLGNYSPLIDPFINAMLNMDNMLVNRLLVGESKGKKDVFTDLRPRFISTNLVPIRKARKYIANALIEAEEMKMLAIPEVEVKKRLDELLLNIPNRNPDLLCEFEETTPDVSILKNSITHKPRGRAGLVTPSWATWGTLE